MIKIVSEGWDLRSFCPTQRKCRSKPS